MISESSPSPEQMEFCRNFLSKWNFAGILFVGLLARIAKCKYFQNGSPREVKFHIQMKSSECTFRTYWATKSNILFILMLPLKIYTPCPSKSGLIAILLGSPVLKMMQFKYIVSSIEIIVSLFVLALTLVDILNFVVEVAPYICVIQLKYLSH